MFQFPALAFQDTGLSHSEIRGSKVICTSPRLFAAYHVLHRLREPRHPPCALIYFLSVLQHCCCYGLYSWLLRLTVIGFVQHVKDLIPQLTIDNGQLTILDSGE